MDDRKILQLLLDRSGDAIGAMERRFGARLMAISLSILGSREDAQESVNDTYLAVWNAIPPKQPDPLAGFVLKVGRNQALKRLRYNTADKRSSTMAVSLTELEDAIPGSALEETVDARQLGASINRFLKAQDALNRSIFLRRYWFGEPAAKIAKEFLMTENTVNVRLSRLRGKLRKHLIEEGYYE